MKGEKREIGEWIRKSEVLNETKVRKRKKGREREGRLHLKIGKKRKRKER